MIQLLLFALLSLSSFAKDDGYCVRLLAPVAPAETLAPVAVEVTQAQQWLTDHGQREPSEADGTVIYSEWEKWKRATKNQRIANLALEIKKISPPNDETIVSLNGRAQLEKLSRANLQRMIVQLESRYPQTAVLLNDKMLEAQSRSVSNLLKFAYTVERPQRSDQGVNPPVVSPQQLHRNNLIPNRDSIYSWLINGSPSAEFDVKMASPKAIRPSAIYLREEVANELGFAIPKLDIIENLFHFFEVWDPAALDEVYAHNRMSFPSKVNSGEKMMDYFKSGAVFLDDVFTPNVPEKLSTLRERLNQYILTEADSKEFLRRAFQLYVLWTKFNKISEYDRLVSGLYSALGPNDAAFRKFQTFAGIPGMSLRIPVVVNAKDYSLERDVPKAEQFKYGLTFGMVDHVEKGGRGRLDHNSKP